MISFERSRPALQLMINVVIVVPEVMRRGRSMRSDGEGGRVGHGAGEAKQVPVEFVIVEVGGCRRRRRYVHCRCCCSCGGGSDQRRKRTKMRR